MEFQAAFQISRMVVFEVRYSTVGSNMHPDFATSAGEFIRSKQDFNRCGQCQEAVLPHNSIAWQFYEKWDPMHLHMLTDEQQMELASDLYILMDAYNYIYREAESFGTGGDGREIAFWEEVELSKMPLKSA